MRTTKVAIATFAAASLLLAACGDDTESSTTETPAPAETEAPAEAQDIVAVASGNPEFSTLVELVSAAGLVETLQGEGPFTVFAPTNAAFEKVPAEVMDMLAADTELLAQVLTYHVVSGKVMSSDVRPGSVPTVQGEELEISVDGSTVKVNDANVIVVDVEASNGVIHVIDSVILPPSVASALAEGSESPTEDTAMGDDAMAGSGTVVDVATEAGSFTTLLSLVEAAGLVETLQGEGPFTVFAPTDEAFAALPAEVREALLLPENAELLADILLYHVVQGAAVTSDQVVAGPVEMANGDEAQLTTADGRVQIDGANVVSADVMASNGVIHVIDAVIIPADTDLSAL